jgi:hypothetical protein
MMKMVAVMRAAATMMTPASKSRRSSVGNAMRKVRRRKGSRPRRIVGRRVGRGLKKCRGIKLELRWSIRQHQPRHHRKKLSNQVKHHLLSIFRGVNRLHRYSRQVSLAPEKPIRTNQQTRAAVLNLAESRLRLILNNQRINPKNQRLLRLRLIMRYQ